MTLSRKSLHPSAALLFTIGLALVVGCSGGDVDTPADAGPDQPADAGGGGEADAGGGEADAGGGEADAGGGEADAGGTDAGGSEADAGGGEADAGAPDAGAPDAGPVVVVETGTLTVDDQVLAPPYKSLVITSARVPADTRAGARVRVLRHDGAGTGALLGSSVLTSGTEAEELAISLSEAILGISPLRVELVNADNSPLKDPSGEPIVRVVSVTGDTEETELEMEDQFIGGEGHRLPPSYDPTPTAGPEFTTPDRTTPKVKRVHVPARFTRGVFLAIYAANNDGAPTGAALGKLKYTTTGAVSGPLTFTSEIDVAGKFVALLREPSASGNWSATAPIIKDLQGREILRTFSIDSLEFQDALEIDDQNLGDNDGPNPLNPNRKVKVRYAAVAEEHAVTQGLLIGFYWDSSGNPGTLMGYGKFASTGEHVDKIFELTQSVGGEHTLHAALRVGQSWNPTAPVLRDRNGREVWRTFKVGASPLSYIDGKEFTAVDPRIIRLEKAYSHDGPAWIVLARDDNGAPGTYLAVKKVPARYQGNVWFHKNETDVEGDGIADNGLQERGWLQSGTIAGYLTGSDPEAFRRCVRGDERLHVLMFKDQGEQLSWEWREGGHDLEPVLTNGATGSPVTARFQVRMKGSIENSQKDSNRYYFPCSSLSQQYENPTSLPVDCRCHVDIIGQHFPECKEDIAKSLNMRFGEGPRVEHLSFGHFRSGFVEPGSNELIALAVWKDHQTYWPENDITIDVGAVMAIDMETRRRRLIGGRHASPEGAIVDIGTGPVLSYPFQIQKGPDGKYYIASYGYVRIDASLTPTVDIIRMDPATGNREYVWRSNHLGYNFNGAQNPYGHCANGRDATYGYSSVQIGRKAFAIDASGNFYLSSAHNGNTPTSDGISILKISPDGTRCDFVTRTKVGAENVLYAGRSIGTGPEPQAGPYHGLLAKDGKLYTTTELTDELWEVDIATGNRRALHVFGVDDNNTGSNGTHLTWDHHRNLIWQMGFSSSTLVYDLEHDRSEPVWCPDNFRYYYGNPKDGSGAPYDLSGVPATVDVNAGRDVVAEPIRNHLIRCQKPAAWGNNGLVLERGMWIHPTNPRYMFVVNSSMIMRADLVAGNSEIFSY